MINDMEKQLSSAPANNASNVESEKKSPPQKLKQTETDLNGSFGSGQQHRFYERELNSGQMNQFHERDLNSGAQMNRIEFDALKMS